MIVETDSTTSMLNLVSIIGTFNLTNSDASFASCSRRHVSVSFASRLFFTLAKQRSGSEPSRRYAGSSSQYTVAVIFSLKDAAVTHSTPFNASLA